MIKTWKHKGLRRFFETGNKSGIIVSHEKKLKIILQRLCGAILLDTIQFLLMVIGGLSLNLMVRML